MSDFCMTEKNEPRETAKDIIINVSTILTEIKNQVDLIESALYGARVVNEDPKGIPDPPPILELLRQQRDFAENILKSIIHIKDGLW